MKNHSKLVLASSSPFRKTLLSKITTEFDTASPDIDESCQPNELPLNLSIRLAFEKASALASTYPNHLIIGSDQVAMLGNRQLTKPGNFENAVEQLSLSSGKVITFYTSLCLLNSKTNETLIDVDICRVHMRELSASDIDHYIKADEPFGCAAAFKSEGLGITLFEKIEGEDPNALVGLPLIKLTSMLKQLGHTVL